MNKSYVKYVGVLAGSCTTLAFIPQVYDIYKTKDTHSLSLLTIIIFTLGQVLWSTYGYLKKDNSVFYFAIFTLILYLYILYAKLTYNKVHDKKK